MKSIQLLSIVLSGFYVAACTKTGVPVVQEPSVKSEYKPQQWAAMGNLPKNITAICQDGSYSTTKGQNACLGNGGIKEAFSRFSE